MKINAFFLNFQINDQKIPLELKLLDKVQKVAGVIRLYDFYETSDSWIYVMEKPSKCMDLFDYILLNKDHDYESIEESQAQDFFHQILKTIIGCYHDQKVIHRDIKAENILVDLESFQVKLIDFGGGRFVKNEAYTSVCGSWQSYPPGEIFSKLNFLCQILMKFLKSCQCLFNEPTTVHR